MSYATVEDMTDLWRPMTAAEQARASPLLAIISASLDVEARKVGKDLSALVAADPALAMVAKSVTVDVAARTLMTSTNQEPLTQFTQAAGGYSASGSFLVPGGGLFMWVDLPEGTDALEMFDFVFQKNIAYVPGQFFCCDGSGKNAMRLNFSTTGEEDIARCIPILGEMIKQYLKK